MTAAGAPDDGPDAHPHRRDPSPLPAVGVVVDARGQRCPLPVISLARRARGLPAGTAVEVLATDPAARHDVPAWARLRGHRVEAEHLDGDGTWHATVLLGER